MHILLVDDSLPFDGYTPSSQPLGGVEKAFASLPAALRARGHEVEVVNRCGFPITADGVSWKPWEAPRPESCDVLIAYRKPALLDFEVEAARRILWIASPGGYLGRGPNPEILARHAAAPIVVSGPAHAATVPAALAGRVVEIAPGLRAPFREAEPMAPANPPRAVVTTHPLMDLDWLIELWTREIRPKVEDAELRIFSAMLDRGLLGGDVPERIPPVLDRALAARDGRRWLEAGEDDWLPAIRDFAAEAMIGLIRDDLARLGIRQEVFTSERALVEAGRVQATLDRLADKGLIYEGVLEPPKGRKPEDWEPRPQTLFRSTDFGDDVDRPLRKSDGSWTYFAADIANHFDKIERGFELLIDVWGADHGGYVKRMKAAVRALSAGAVELDVKLCQMVKLMRRGEPVKMSKRAGSFVTLREVVDEVGRDVVRFIMLTRKNDAPLDFDLARVTEQSKDNPVFYVQYAHARVHSVLRNARAEIAGLEASTGALARAPLDRLTDEGELALIKLLAAWPRQVETAAEAHEPHRIAFYMHDVAAAFHGLWNKGKENPALRFIVAEDRALTEARLALLRAVELVIAAGLRIFGVEPVEEMR